MAKKKSKRFYVVAVYDGEDLLLHDLETGKTAFGIREPNLNRFTRRVAEEALHKLNAARPADKDGPWGGYELREDDGSSED